MNDVLATTFVAAFILIYIFELLGLVVWNSRKRFGARSKKNPPEDAQKSISPEDVQKSIPPLEIPRDLK